MKVRMLKGSGGEAGVRGRTGGGRGIEARRYNMAWRGEAAKEIRPHKGRTRTGGRTTSAAAVEIVLEEDGV